MWFTGNNDPGLVGRITLPPLVRDMAADKITTTSARLRGEGARELAGHRVPLRVRHHRRAYGQRRPRHMPASGYDLSDGDDGRRRACSRAPSTTTGWSPRTTPGTRARRASGPRRFSTEPPVVEPDADRARVASQVEPDFGKSVVVEPEGTVMVKAPGGGWETMEPGAEMPRGRDLRHPPRARVAHQRGLPGRTPRPGTFGGGLFTLRQPREGCGRVDVYLRGGSFRAARAWARQAARAVGRVASRLARPRVRKLWGRDSGGQLPHATAATARRRCAAPAG